MNAARAGAAPSVAEEVLRFLRVGDLIPAAVPRVGHRQPTTRRTGWNNMEQAWRTTSSCSTRPGDARRSAPTGIDGDTFKHEYLMDKYGIQINKTSRNTVLFMTNIGTTRCSVAYLIEVLVKIAAELDERLADMSAIEKRTSRTASKSLTLEQPPLPDFSSFHSRSAAAASKGVPRRATATSAARTSCPTTRRTASTSACTEAAEAIRQRARTGVGAVRHPLSAGLPGAGAGAGDQRRDPAFHDALDVREIHGYRPNWACACSPMPRSDGRRSHSDARCAGRGRACRFTIERG